MATAIGMPRSFPPAAERYPHGHAFRDVVDGQCRQQQRCSVRGLGSRGSEMSLLGEPQVRVRDDAIEKSERDSSRSEPTEHLDHRTTFEGRNQQAEGRRGQHDSCREAGEDIEQSLRGFTHQEKGHTAQAGGKSGRSYPPDRRWIHPLIVIRAWAAAQ
jgi:hypothetical protein